MQNSEKEDSTPITPNIIKNIEELRQPNYLVAECSTICPVIMGHTAIAKFYITNMIPKAVPVILLLTTIGMEGMMQFAQKQQAKPSMKSPQEAPDHDGYGSSGLH